MSDIRTTVDRELRRHLVSRNIFCPRTGEVLDVRTAVFFVDRDGDPTAVLSPNGYRDLLDTDPDMLPMLAERAGVTPDPTTLPKD